MKWTPPDWMYRNKTPENDSQYFENLTRCIFQAGLNWKVIQNKWPNFIKAFDEFDVSKIALYTDSDFNRLINDSSIVRNRSKILATIHNAKEFKKIAHEHGSFGEWLRSMDKSSNYEIVISVLKSSFKHVGPSTAHIFLFSVGEDIRYDESAHMKR
jgi:3-methyladenine DNA glycosylase Tag